MLLLACLAASLLLYGRPRGSFAGSLSSERRDRREDRDRSSRDALFPGHARRRGVRPFFLGRPALPGTGVVTTSSFSRDRATASTRSRVTFSARSTSLLEARSPGDVRPQLLRARRRRTTRARAGRHAGGTTGGPLRPRDDSRESMGGDDGRDEEGRSARGRCFDAATSSCSFFASCAGFDIHRVISQNIRVNIILILIFRT